MARLVFAVHNCLPLRQLDCTWKVHTLNEERKVGPAGSNAGNECTLCTLCSFAELFIHKVYKVGKLLCILTECETMYHRIENLYRKLLHSYYTMWNQYLITYSFVYQVVFTRKIRLNI